MNEKPKPKQAPIHTRMFSLTPSQRCDETNGKGPHGDTKAFELINVYSHGKPTAKGRGYRKDGDPSSMLLW